MKPTNELRFLEREVIVRTAGICTPALTKPVIILQQKWVKQHLCPADNTYEWRDVPIEKEVK